MLIADFIAFPSWQASLCYLGLSKESEHAAHSAPRRTERAELRNRSSVAVSPSIQRHFSNSVGVTPRAVQSFSTVLSVALYRRFVFEIFFTVSALNPAFSANSRWVSLAPVRCSCRSRHSRSRIRRRLTRSRAAIGVLAIPHRSSYAYSAVVWRDNPYLLTSGRSARAFRAVKVPPIKHRLNHRENISSALYSSIVRIARCGATVGARKIRCIRSIATQGRRV